jgi:hypothetical protein
MARRSTTCHLCSCMFADAQLKFMLEKAQMVLQVHPSRDNHETQNNIPLAYAMSRTAKRVRCGPAEHVL